MCNGQAFTPAQRTWSTTTIVVLVCLLALVARVVYAAVFPICEVHDQWDHIAANLAAGRGYVSAWPKTYIDTDTLNLPDYDFPLVPTASHVPVPVIYFAMMYGLFGLNDQSLVIGQWILDVLTCALLFGIALEVFADRRVAVLTSMAWTFYVPELWMSNSRYSEPMTAFLLACLAYTLLGVLRTHSIWWFGLAGVMWGLATLSRPAIMILPVLLLPVLVVLLRHQLGLAVLVCAAITLGGVVVISPWVYRNFEVFGAFIPTSTLGGQNIFRDHYLIDRDDYLRYRGTRVVAKAAKEMFDRRFGSVAVVETADNTQPLIDRVYREEAIAKIRQYPGRYTLLSLVRVLRLWFNVGYGSPPSWRSYLILVGHLTLLGLIVKALVSYPGTWMRKMTPMFTFVVHHTLSYMAIAGEFRYSVPLMPYLMMVSSYALVRIFEENRSEIIDQVFVRPIAALWRGLFDVGHFEISAMTDRTTASENKHLALRQNGAQKLDHPALFLAWSPPSHTRRSELMARKLGIPLRRIHVLKKRRCLAPLRYAIQGPLTLATLFREGPRVVFVQNPPIFAPLFAWFYCALARADLIIDSHTDAIQCPRLWRWSLPLHRFLSRRAVTTIVTNEHLGQIVAGWGATSQVITDVPSQLPTGRSYPVEHSFNVAMVSSFAPDEPLDNVVQAAMDLPDVGFYVTGDPAWSSRRLPTDLPPNLHLTGFLPDDDYYGLLRSVDAIMALTTADHTMQRGACEAVWLGRPIITSHWPLLRQCFGKGTVHVDNTIEGIRAGVSEVRARHTQLTEEVLLLQEERRQQWEEITARLEASILEAWDGRRPRRRNQG